MNKKVIVAPLNWGLGHASRCVPIIHFLLENKFTPIIASDGISLSFLKKEFPNLETLELPSYGISYTNNLKFGLLVQTPKILKAIKKEQRFIADFLIKNKDIVGVISDNRFGVRSAKIPSVYITHQINVLSGFTTKISSYIHQKTISKFDECWVPDNENHQLSGLLSTIKNKKFNIKYIGVLSRFKKRLETQNNDILVILSGIESQRKSLEKRILSELKNYKGNIVLVLGKIEKEQIVRIENGIKIFNYLLSSELEREINKSELVICRSGYSSIMDLSVLNKKALFIPTPNQPEQEYLAKYLEKENVASFVSENEFSVDKLENMKNYKGLSSYETKLDKNLLSLFERK